jgi:hypothetical protein
MKTPLLLLPLFTLPLHAAEIRIPVDRQNRPVAEAIARSNATRHQGKERIEAAVTLGRKPQALGTGRQGVYQQLDMGPQMRARIELHFPEAKPGDKVAIGVMDGGRILLQDADRRVHPAPGQKHQVGADQRIRFIFETGTGHGIYRVRVRHGLETRELEFWVGPKPEPSKRPAPGKEAVALNR